MKTIKIGLAAVIALTAITSCKKLELYPYNSIENSQSFQSVKDAKTWNSGLYATFKGRQYGIYTYATDVQADQLNASLDFGNRNGNPHRWGDSFLADDYTIRDIWAGYYSAIANINVALAGFDNIKPATAAETSELSRYKGDALLARAFYYHNLVIRWAKPYSASSAASDPGVPLLTSFNIAEMPARSSVKQVYDQILLDIAKAKELLKDVPGTPGAKVFNIDVVTALEARVKLHMGDWAGAYGAANTLIASGKYPLINTPAALKSYWHSDGVQESIFQSFTNKPSELANTNAIYLGLNAQTGRFTPDFIPSQWVIDMYPATDIRKTVYFESKTLFIQGTAYPNVSLVNKYPGNPALFTAASTNYQHAPKVFRIAEMYLIAAEAAAKGGNPGNAIIALNALRTARGIGAAVTTGDVDLLQSIKDERFRELAFEGFRLDDLKRWHEGFNRKSPQNVNLINTGANYNTLTIAPDADKFVWGLPTNDITINKNLAQNKGW